MLSIWTPRASYGAYRSDSVTCPGLSWIRIFTPPARGVGPTILNGFLILLPRTAFAASFGGFFTPARDEAAAPLSPATDTAAPHEKSSSTESTHLRASAATAAAQGIASGNGAAVRARSPRDCTGSKGLSGSRLQRLQIGASPHFDSVATVAPFCETVGFFFATPKSV